MLSGGATARPLYAAAAHLDAVWSQWHVYFADERCPEYSLDMTKDGEGFRLGKAPNGSAIVRVHGSETSQSLR